MVLAQVTPVVRSLAITFDLRAESSPPNIPHLRGSCSGAFLVNPCHALLTPSAGMEMT